jgi:hypothetical protein
MASPPRLLIPAACVIASLACAPRAFAQVSSFKISIPQKGTNIAGAFPPVGTVKALVTVANGNPVVFTIKPDAISGVNITPTSAAFSSVSPGSAQPTSLSFSYSDVTRTDTVSLVPPPVATDSTLATTYEIDFHVQSDFNVSCAAQHPTRTFTVSVRATDPGITGACLESFDADSTGGCSAVNDSLHFVPLDGTDGPNATLVGEPAQTHRCQRLPIDVVMVLDKSGSMADSAMGTPAQPKIVSLQKAVKNFVDVWDSLRQEEANSGTSLADKIGVVIFDSTAKWWGDPALNPGLILNQDLNSIDSSNNPNVSISNFLKPATCNAGSCGELVPGTATSIGEGLVQANSKLSSTSTMSDGNRHVVLVMTDGMQNTNRMVRVYDPSNPTDANPANPTQIATYLKGSPATVTPLTASSSYTVYPVTVGTGSAVDTFFANGASRLPGSFYMNTEDDAALLSPMFLEILQNFIKFFSYETVRIISERTPYSATIPISTTSHNVVFSLTWPSQATLRLTIVPPRGTQPIVKESASGLISFVQPLPLAATFDPTGEWKVKVEAVSSAPGAAAPLTSDSVSFDFHAMTDDAGIKSDLAVVSGDYKPGNKIRLRAKLTRFGIPILGLGAHPGDRIEAALIRPGKSIGDILSESTESANPSGTDPQSPAEAKLDNTLRKDPTKLKRETVPSVTLYDDGKSEHGDDVAGDGIYNALYPATLPGHYNFTLAAESISPDSVRFSRQQLRTVYVRPFPDPGNTEFQSTIRFGRNGASNIWSIVMMPRTKAGDRMGPGWANYFWFTAAGVIPFKPTDKLDGTYAADLAFTGTKPPDISLHFEDVLVVIGDSVTPDKLPQPLGSDNVVSLVAPPNQPGRVAAFFDFGPNFPHGTFGSVFNTGVSLNAGLEYIAHPHFALEGIFGYHHFPGSLVGDLNVYQFSANGKSYLTNGNIRPFVNGGVGGYKFSPGSIYFGGNVGGGMLYTLTARFGLQLSYNLHVVNTGPATKFSDVQFGVRWVF